jgi:hypothetical protein
VSDPSERGSARDATTPRRPTSHAPSLRRTGQMPVECRYPDWQTSRRPDADAGTTSPLVRDEWARVPGRGGECYDRGGRTGRLTCEFPLR